MHYVIIRQKKEVQFMTGMLTHDWAMLGKEDNKFYWSRDIDNVNGYFSFIGNDIILELEEQMRNGYEIQLTEWSKESEKNPIECPPKSKFFKMFDGETIQSETQFGPTIKYHDIF